METPVKHYKFINSRTDNVIYYHSLESNLSPEQVREKLETLKAQVARNNGVFLDTIYWEEIKENED
ncbi:hypothetical protein LLH06_13695 [Mucilaginibacter daejeonensis]|uniref:hypothetical protein n=1 Tax=Mucilaginibacter daejeonensis TaxID=398049 RepID=UPI001D17CD73|nr:hypothetical protein [Mucilaginibacter daejeonensis]UEG52016.1 hypothetical protein LLH06_13695 [Mucilaginibacter daejeonensis]